MWQKNSQTHSQNQINGLYKPSPNCRLILGFTTFLHTFLQCLFSPVFRMVLYHHDPCGSKGPLPFSSLSCRSGEPSLALMTSLARCLSLTSESWCPCESGWENWKTHIKLGFTGWSHVFLSCWKPSSMLLSKYWGCPMQLSFNQLLGGLKRMPSLEQLFAVIWTVDAMNGGGGLAQIQAFGNFFGSGGCPAIWMVLLIVSVGVASQTSFW